MTPATIEQAKDYLKQRDNLLSGADALGKAALILAGWEVEASDKMVHGLWTHRDDQLSPHDFGSAIRRMKERQLK